MKLSEKAAYIKGLMDGLNVTDATNEGKVLRAMAELLAEMAGTIEVLDDDMSQIYDDVDELEELVDGLDDDDDIDEDEDDENAPMYEVECPACGELVYVSEEDLDEGEAFCAACGKSFGIELTEDEEGEEEEMEEDAVYQVTCPACGAVSEMDEESLLSGNACCVSCGASLELELDESSDEA